MGPLKHILLLLMGILFALSLHAQGMAGRWLVYEGDDGAELVVSLSSAGNGSADFSLIRRFEAVSYGEGSQFWGTFRATGGYYFIVKSSKTVNIRLTQTDSTLVVAQRGKPSVSVSAWLDEAYSTSGLSDAGGYKQQVLAQWKRDFPYNKDVKKYKRLMEECLTGYYDEAFEVLLEGRYRIVERTETTLKLQNLDFEIPLMTWKRLPK